MCWLLFVYSDIFIFVRFNLFSVLSTTSVVTTFLFMSHPCAKCKICYTINFFFYISLVHYFKFYLATKDASI
nr:hypothetical protein Itr_chr01CG11930 [Ipomoea trifida]